MSNTNQIRKHRNQAGFTLIELMIAGVLLAVGVAAMSGLVGLAVKNNGHSRLDSTATMLNQAVVEQVSEAISFKASCQGSGTLTITDCAGNPHTVDTAGPGAPLITTNPDPTKIGYIDFSVPQDTTNGYEMDYAVCNGNTKVYYDVRWNVQTISTTSSSFTTLLTVGTRMQGGSAIINFPINMRVMLGPDPKQIQTKCQ
jgi:prepilin-type N-terminal cleavage/methylation domain-containing protein